MSAVVETQIKPFYETQRFSLFCGDCRSVLPTLDDCSVDSIVTDPPYELGFMGKGWDRSGIAYDVEVWRECLRALKPGGHLLAFGGSRTYHRLACAIEDAGFEIRDQIQWIYGSGFPKSLDVSKAIDAAAGVAREIVGVREYAGRHVQRSSDDKLAPPIGTFVRTQDDRLVSAAATDAAKQWNGWGTALKPAHEPIVLARKPLIGTVAENVLQHGTGSLNIDGSRIGTGEDKTEGGCNGKGRMFNGGISQQAETDFTVGRWPANVIHDGSNEVLAGFPESNGGAWPANGARFGYAGGERQQNGHRTEMDNGSAARFFYCAKASQDDRNEGLEDLEIKSAGAVTDRKDGSAGLNSPRAGAGRTHGSRNNHPTVKPTELMRYLCRLITPPRGVVLDPFCGSGSTGKAAMLEGLRFIGIELSADYCELAQRRIEAVTRQGVLFA